MNTPSQNIECVEMMRAVYEIMHNDRSLLEPLWRIVDSYIKLSHGDKIMYALAVRAEPVVHAVLYNVVDELDEEIWLRYDYLDDVKWCDMGVIERLASMKFRTFRCEYIRRFHEIRTEASHDSKSIIDWVASLFNEFNYGDVYSCGTREVKCKFARAIFGGWLKK